MMMAAVMLLVMITMHATGKGLLWKVTGNNLSKPTYIVGSHHFIPATMIDSISGLRDAIAAADVVYGEIEAEKLTSPEAMKLMMEMSAAPADSTLDKVLTPEQMSQLDNVLAKYAGMPGLAAQLTPMKPALVSTQITVMQTSKAIPGLNLMAEQFDTGVMNYGKSLGKPVRGLETLESQMNLLLGASIASQADDLVKAVELDDKSCDMIKRLTDAYMAGDIELMLTLMTDAEIGASPEEMERTIYSRNRDWVAQLKALMPKESLMVVVGSGHLPGDEGMINLLRKAGYTVEPVK